MAVKLNWLGHKLGEAKFLVGEIFWGRSCGFLWNCSAGKIFVDGNVQGQILG